MADIEVRFPRGAWVRYSDYGIGQVRPRDPKRVGRVDGYSNDRQAVRVIWSGTKTGSTYGENLIEVIPQENTQ